MKRSRLASSARFSSTSNDTERLEGLDNYTAPYMGQVTHDLEQDSSWCRAGVRVATRLNQGSPHVWPTTPALRRPLHQPAGLGHCLEERDTPIWRSAQNRLRGVSQGLDKGSLRTRRSAEDPLTAGGRPSRLPSRSHDVPPELSAGVTSGKCSTEKFVTLRDDDGLNAQAVSRIRAWCRKSRSPNLLNDEVSARWLQPLDRGSSPGSSDKRVHFLQPLKRGAFSLSPTAPGSTM